MSDAGAQRGPAVAKSSAPCLHMLHGHPGPASWPPGPLQPQRLPSYLGMEA